MKKILLLTIGLALSLSILYAQHQKPKNQSAQKNERVEKQDSLWQQLDLTVDQQTQIKKIKANAKSEAAKLKADSTLLPQDKKEKLRSIKIKSEKSIRDILTPEQKEKLKSLIQQQILEKTANDLGLNEEQKNKLAVAQKDFHERTIQLHEQMDSTRKEFTIKIKSFLSEEQFKQYMDKMKKMIDAHHPPVEHRHSRMD